MALAVKDRILVTGSTGFIGRHLVNRLPEYEVFKASRSSSIDLLKVNDIKKLLKEVRPKYLVHLAWEATPGTYWTDPINKDWAEKSEILYQEFLNNGGERAVFAGSVAEYEWKGDLYIEDETPISPATLYGQCKADLFQRLTRIDDGKFSWGRLFYLYGDHEAPNRLVSGAFESLLKNQAFATTEGTQIRDYMHVNDAADAFKKILFSNVKGAVNIASGDGLPVKEILQAIGRITGRGELIQFGKIPIRPNDPKKIVADVRKLKNIGWKQKIGIQKGLEQTYQWWRQ